jgi:hypothetical protein
LLLSSTSFGRDLTFDFAFYYCFIADLSELIEKALIAFAGGAKSGFSRVDL